jgi:hypothetical protein
MQDDQTDPSERAHIDPESTFSLIERARAGDDQALERLFCQTPGAVAEMGQRSPAEAGTRSR